MSIYLNETEQDLNSLCEVAQKQKLQRATKMKN